MFSCSSCLSSCLRAVASEVRTLRRAPRTSALRELSSPRWQHSYAHADRQSHKQDESSNVDKVESLSAQTKQVALPRSFNARHLQMEVERLTDPLRMADNTKRLLQAGDAEKAYELIKLASRTMICTVSWNHLLDYHLEKKEVHKAWKLYNDMKKRAQALDAYTFMIMLRGLAANSRNSQALEKAELVYRSMHGPNSPVKPNRLHSNTMLHACSVAGNLDKMFEIAAEIPTSGKYAPDLTTYAIILKGIQAFIEAGVSHRTNTEELKEKRAEAILQAKRIWSDIIHQWKAETLRLDEQLVCTMGHLLLSPQKSNKAIALSDEKRFFRPPHEMKESADDVLSLVEQTMQIPRHFPKGEWQGSRKAAEPRQAIEIKTASNTDQGLGQSEFMARLDQGALDTNASANMDTSYSVIPAGDRTFDVVANQGSFQRSVRPGNSTISMIIMACTQLQEYEAASRYWRHLTQILRPDLENCHTYLRLLRYQRASRLVVDLVSAMNAPRSEGGFAVGVENKTYIIAMSACVRDVKNPSSLKNAVELAKSMRENVASPPQKAIVDFHLIMKLRGREKNLSTALAAINCLESMWINEKNKLTFGAFEGESIPKVRTKSGKEMTGRPTIKTIQDVFQIAALVESAMHAALTHYSDQMTAGSLSALKKRHMAIRTWINNKTRGGKPFVPIREE